MLSLPSSVRIFLCLEPADMRRSFDGLAAVAEEVVGESPLSGHLFVFRNRRSDRVKVLYWDRDGYAIWYKRLEEGTFRFPTSLNAASAQRAEVKASDLMMLLDGVDLLSVKRQRRYTRQLVEVEDGARRAVLV
jgi:transposase